MNYKAFEKNWIFFLQIGRYGSIILLEILHTKLICVLAFPTTKDIKKPNKYYSVCFWFKTHLRSSASSRIIYCRIFRFRVSITLSTFAVFFSVNSFFSVCSRNRIETKKNRFLIKISVRIGEIERWRSLRSDYHVVCCYKR